MGASAGDSAGGQAWVRCAAERRCTGTGPSAALPSAFEVSANPHLLRRWVVEQIAGVEVAVDEIIPEEHLGRDVKDELGEVGLLVGRDVFDHLNPVNRARHRIASARQRQ